MSFMEKLLDDVEVEWKMLGEIGKVCMCKRILKSQTSSGGEIPFYKIGTFGKEPDAYIPRNLFDEYKSKYSYPKIGEILISASGTIGRTVIFNGEDAYFQDSNIVWIENDESTVLNKFLFYFYKIANWGISKGGTIQRLYNDNLRKLLIPIPYPNHPEKSLKIQAKIVRILDTFTSLTTELTARKKQYNYYREQLLNFEEEEVEWKTLGDISLKSYSGGTPTAGTSEYYDGGTIPWLRTQEVKLSDIERTAVKITPAALKNSSAKWIPENCVIVAISGATAGRSAINKIPLTTNQHCCCLEIDSEKALYRYIFHWVSFNYEALKGLGQGARGDLNSGIIKNFKIPIPNADDPEKSLREQARIVAILDKFDILTNSISEGLPREIKLRKQQYEYYRDLLLSFPKPEVVAQYE